MGLVLTTDAANEPVTAEEAKEYLRVDTGDTSQDNVITILIAAARRKVEQHIRQALISQTWTWDIDSDDAQNPIWLPRPPVQSITSLTTYDSDGNATVTGSSSYELVEGLKLVARADGWEINRKERAATIVYVTGAYTDSTDTPADIRLAVLKIIATMYEVREDVMQGSIAPVVLGADSKYLLEDYIYNGP